MVAPEIQYAIETFSLTKVFTDWWGRNKVRAVEDLDLQIKHNEVFGLLGPNGSGKTTTLKMLLNLLYPTKGKCLVLGGESSDPKISARIGFLPEESYLYRYLSARETLDFYGKIFGLDRRSRKRRIDALLEMVGLQAVANRPVGTFSKGMARRIGLAQALINDPDLLILDEPTTGLDPIGTRQIKDLIIQLARRGKTILLSSHLLADVEDVCDRIAILYGGRMQTHGRVAELLRRTDKNQITAGRLSKNALEKIRGIIEAEDSECEITCPMEKLESFFINVVEQARHSGQVTSGAESTTQIGDFLISPDTSESILDKLVSAPVSEEPSVESEEQAATQPVERAAPAANEELLDDLTRGGGSVKTEPVGGQPGGSLSEDESRDERPVSRESEPGRPDEDLLDRLTRRPPAAADENDEHEQGDS